MKRLRDACAVLLGRKVAYPVGAVVIPPHPDDEFDEFDTPPEEIARMLREGEHAELDMTRGELLDRIGKGVRAEIVHSPSRTHEFHGEMSATVDGVFSVGGIPLGTTPYRF